MVYDRPALPWAGSVLTRQETRFVLPRFTFLWLSLLLGLSACAGSGAPSQEQRASQASGARSQRALVVAVRVEPVSLALRPLQDSGQTVRFTTRFFNAG